jgi:hypothetical protein
LEEYGPVRERKNERDKDSAERGVVILELSAIAMSNAQ